MKVHGKLVLAVSLAVAAFSLSACNTVKGSVQGAGQDVKAVVDTVNPPPSHRTVKKSTKHKQYAKKKSTHTVTSTDTGTTTTNTGTTTDTNTTNSTTTTNQSGY
jgi:predicted small secreted protein